MDAILLFIGAFAVVFFVVFLVLLGQVGKP